MLKKLIRFINQDSQFDNEPKRLTVLLRWLYLLMAVNYIVFTVLMYQGASRSIFWLGIIFLGFVAAGLYLTYRVRMIRNLIVCSLVMMVWIITFIYLFGWDCGVQHFMFAILVLVYFAVYDALPQKILFTALLFLLRFCLFSYCRVFDPVIQLSGHLVVLLQIVNSLFLFIMMGVICGIYSSNMDSAEWKLVEYNEKLQVEAATDPLTGIKNRRSMMEYMNSYLEQNKKSMSTIVLADIDHFKNINDKWGHNCGDAVLVWLTGIFCLSVEGRGQVCRWGGEEFLFFFHDLNGDEVYHILTDLKVLLDGTPFMWNGQPLAVTLTYGVEEYDFRSDITELVERVDKKLYRGKAEGRDQIVY